MGGASTPGPRADHARRVAGTCGRGKLLPQRGACAALPRRRAAGDAAGVGMPTDKQILRLGRGKLPAGGFPRSFERRLDDRAGLEKSRHDGIQYASRSTAGRASRDDDEQLLAGARAAEGPARVPGAQQGREWPGTFSAPRNGAVRLQSFTDAMTFTTETADRHAAVDSGRKWARSRTTKRSWRRSWTAS